MSGKHRAPAHRAIIYAGVLGALSNEEINEMLATLGERPLPARSYEAIRNHYVPHFKQDLRRLGRAILHPPTFSDLSEAGVVATAGTIGLESDGIDDLD